jgi:glucose-1-phosphate cytidylyltransferase
MKIVILAGGFGSRLSEETDIKPKPMVEIGGKPIIWHIMKLYSYYGFNEFVILLGYKSYVIKEFFSNYMLHQSDITIDVQKNTLEIHNNQAEPWKITLVDTGLNTMTGGRILKAKKYIGEDTFMLTYGDGVSDINIIDLLDFHKAHKRTVTMSSAQPDARFGALQIDEKNQVTQFLEKPVGDQGWINAGFFVCNKRVFDYLDSDACVFEKEPLENLAKDGELYTFKHNGFWKPMDTLRDKHNLEYLYENKLAPWKKW